MKKTLIATAVAAVIAAPAAMADITLGGQLQAEIVNASGDGVIGNGDDVATGSGEGIYMSDGWEGGKANSGSASAFFIKGSHDIGNGLTGLYKLNLKPKFGDGVNEIGGRDAFIGLKGGFGTILLGKLATPYKSSTVKWDPFLGTFMQARGNGGMSGPGHNGYLDNTLAYANKFGPATIVAAVGFDESHNNPTNTANPRETDGDHGYTFSVNAPIGPVELAAAYIDSAGRDGVLGKGVAGIDADAANNGNNVEAIKVGLKYGGGDISPLTLAAHYETIDVGGVAAFDQIFATAGYMFGANTVSLNAGVRQPDKGDDGEYYALGLNHAFNKSVSALIGVSKSDDQDGKSNDDDDVTLAGLSMRVKF